MQNTLKQMGSREWLMLISLSVLWGGSFFLVAMSLNEIPPLTVVALRSSLAALFLILFVLLTRRRFPTEPSIWLAFLIMSIFNNAIPFSLIVWGQTQIASGLASILNSTAPMFSLIFAHIYTHDEKLSFNKVLGLVVGFMGVSLIIGLDFLLQLDGSVLGQLAVIGAAMSYAVAGVYGRRFGRLGVRPMVLATGQVTGSSLIMIPMALLFENPLRLPFPSETVVWSLIALALLSTVLAYMLYFRILESAGATNALLVTLLIPISAIAFGTAFLGERLTANHFAGMVLIATGLLVIDGRLWRLIRNRV